MSLELAEINDSAEFIWVLQNQLGTTSAERNNPVIKTFGLGGCGALTLYDPEARMVTLAHISPSVLMAQKMQERVVSQRLKSQEFDHLLSQINKLFYSLEDNGSHSARYAERGKLIPWLVCSYEELTKEILQRMKWASVDLAQDHIFTQPDLTAIAFDTVEGKLFRLKLPIVGNANMTTLDMLTAQLGNINHTTDPRSL